MFRIITGSVMIGIGIWFGYLALITEWVFLFHALFLGGIGAAILLNKHEDKIEEINQKDSNEK